MSAEVELIKDVGFPIAAFLLMFWFATKTLSENTKKLTELTLVMQSLCDNIKGERKQ